jgi:hypothetical protein
VCACVCVFIFLSDIPIHMFSGLDNVITKAPLPLSLLLFNCLLSSLDSTSEIPSVNSHLHSYCSCPFSDTIHFPDGLSQARAHLTCHCPA